MTIAELEARENLPWGLHDAELRALHVDYVDMRLVIEVLVQYGERQDRERLARLVVDDLLFLVVDPPDLQDDGSMETRSGRVDPVGGLLAAAVGRLPKLPSDAYGESVFVSDWNAFFHFAAKTSPRLEWVDVELVAKGKAGALFPGDDIQLPREAT